jgi:hypothetical protein
MSILKPIIDDIVQPILKSIISGGDSGDSTPSLLLEDGTFLLLENETQLYLE